MDMALRYRIYLYIFNNYRYANVVKNLQYAMAISPLIPFGVIMCITGLIGLYWADKYLLLRGFVCDNFLTYQLLK